MEVVIGCLYICIVDVLIQCIDLCRITPGAKDPIPFSFADYQHGIRLTTNIDGKVLITFNARNEHDRSKFVEDLKEAILEVSFS